MEAIPEMLMVFCTFPNRETGVTIARTLVEEQLCACVNLCPGMQSIYRWKGTIVEEQEVLGILKTTSSRYPLLVERIQKLHPYQLPEIVALSTTDVEPSYLAWLQSNLISPKMAL